MTLTNHDQAYLFLFPFKRLCVSGNRKL